MNKFVIIVDSCVDLSIEKVKDLDLIVVPLKVEIDGKIYSNYPDEREIKATDFYSLLREEKVAITSQVNSYQFSEEMEKVLKDGYDVLYVGFSSALSGTFNSFAIAKDELKDKYPNRKIIAVDSLCASLGHGLLVTYASNMRKQGKSIDDVAKWLEENKLHLVHLFTIDDLSCLKRGGRLSGSAALIGTMLHLKPLLHVSNEGKLVATGKVFGRKNSLKKLVEKMGDNIIDPQNQVVYISHGDCIEEANYVADLIKETYKVKDVYINFVGPVIGAHSGPGTIAIFFLGKER